MTIEQIRLQIEEYDRAIDRDATDLYSHHVIMLVKARNKLISKLNKGEQTCGK